MASSSTAFGLLAVLCVFSVRLPGAISQEETSLVPAEAAVNSFALDLYRALVNEPGVTNLAFAPLSISAGLSALYFGAKGETRRQIHDALRFKDDDSPAWLTGRVAEFQAEAVDEKGIIKERNLFNIVTRVFLAKGIPVNPEFSESVGGTQSINFGDPASAVEEINDFVYEETEGLISGLMGENTIDHRTSMVLVNAIYFKGLWKTQFDETRPGKFKGVQGTQEVDFMFVTGTFNRAQRTDIGATVLELPYKNSAFSMFILLPFREDGFDAMEEAIRAFDDEIFKDSMKEENDMYISLPKFGFQAQLDLSVLLPGLGIVDVFDAEKSNLSGISDSKGLHLSSAVHRALIQVDEVGTVAAAVTEGIITPLAAPPIFTADRPFMFVIRDNVEDMVLFMGRVMSI